MRHRSRQPEELNERTRMSTRKETVKICDVCKKRVSDDGEITFGGHVHNGWFKLNEHGGGLTYPHEIERPSCRKCRRIMESRGALTPLEL